jgi:hypothetical protein
MVCRMDIKTQLRKKECCFQRLLILKKNTTLETVHVCSRIFPLTTLMKINLQINYGKVIIYHSMIVACNYITETNWETKRIDRKILLKWCV